MKRTNELGRMATLSMVSLLSFIVAAPAGSAEVPGITNDTILIGASQPFTGPTGALGEMTVAGVMTYLNAINEQGGIYGRKIRYKTENDEYQPAKAIASAKKLAELDKVFALLTPIGVAPVVATIPYVVENNIPLLFPYAPSSDLLVPFKRNIFMITPSLYRQWYFIADYGVRVLEAKKVCQVQMTGPGIEGATKGVEDRLAEAGLKSVGSELIKAGQMDFSALILRFKAADPDFCALGGVQVLTSLMLKEAKKQGFKPRLGFMTHASNVDPELIRLSGEAAEGVMATEITKSPSDSNEPAMVEFRERLKKHYPKLQPGQFALHGYVAAKLFCEAMKRVGQDPTREKLIQSMETIRDFDIGVMAPLSFSPTQHMGLAYCRVTKITKGKFIPFTDWIAYPDKEWVASK